MNIQQTPPVKMASFINFNPIMPILKTKYGEKFWRIDFKIQNSPAKLFTKCEGSETLDELCPVLNTLNLLLKYLKANRPRSNQI